MSAGVRPWQWKDRAVGKERRGEHRARAGPGKASRRWWAGAAAPTVRDTGEAVGGTKAKMWMPEDLRAQRASDAAAAKLVAKQQVERLV